jgi:hypothetical protein
MNKMKAVCELLGLEWIEKDGYSCSEEFKIYDTLTNEIFASDLKGVLNTYTIDEEGLFVEIQTVEYEDGKMIDGKIARSWHKHNELHFLLNGQYVPLKHRDIQ